MGIEESKDIQRDDSNTSEKENEDSPVICPHCSLDNEEVVATYRCRLHFKGMDQIYEHPKLLKYWKPPFMIEGGLYHISYLACDKCINEVVEPIFTHYPSGWTEESNEEVMYEMAKIK